MGKSSLQKSHSVTSNFKLTLLCFFLTLFSNAIFFGIVLLKYVDKTFGIITISISTLLTLLSIFLLSRFTR